MISNHIEQNIFLELEIDNESLWQIKKKILQKTINLCQQQEYSIEELEIIFEMIQGKIQLLNLSSYLNNLDQQGYKEFWEKILPFISASALKMECLFQKNSIKILRKDSQQFNILTKEQICCLLSNMFFFTSKKQVQHVNLNEQKDDIIQEMKIEEHPLQLPRYVDMKNILTKVEGQLENQCNIQKIFCIVNYFKRIMISSQSDLQLKIIYQRKKLLLNQTKLQYLYDSTFDQNLNKIFLQPLQIDNSNSIQHFEDKFECIQSDFADKYVGGGVLNKGCVQEEIMFIISPELIPSILFCERLADDEVVQISGAEQYSKYRGYGPSFEYAGNYISQIQVDQKLQIKLAHYTIYDAMNFRNRESEQYQWQNILRDLSKAYLAFNHIGDYNLSLLLQPQVDQEKNFEEIENQYLPIITGNWGCGMYKGDAQLKLFIQWISASLNDKQVVYCTFGNPLLKDAQKVIEAFQGRPINEIVKLIQDFLLVFRKQEFFQFLLQNTNK